MNTKQAKPTPGPVKVEGGSVTDRKDIPVASCYVGSFRTLSESHYNARFIAEAFNVYHETGLTPRELAEQRAELLAALKLADTVLRGLKYFGPERDVIAAAIAKAEGKE